LTYYKTVKIASQYYSAAWMHQRFLGEIILLLFQGGRLNPWNIHIQAQEAKVGLILTFNVDPVAGG
jgi:hypothetical protein